MRTLAKPLIFSIIAMLPFITSCDSDKWPFGVKGKGPIVTEERSFDSVIKGLDLSIDAKVYVTQSDENKFRIEAQSNILDVLETELNGDVVKIKFNCNVRKHDEIRIFAYIPETKYFEIDGSGTITAADTVYTDEIQFEIKGSGDINFAVVPTDANTDTYIYSNIDGSGEIELLGKAYSHEISIQGSGEIEAYYLMSDKTSIDIEGSGTCWVYTRESLHVSIDGSGNVYYGGNPSDIVKHISGSGSVVKYP